MGSDVSSLNINNGAIEVLTFSLPVNTVIKHSLIDLNTNELFFADNLRIWTLNITSGFNRTSLHLMNPLMALGIDSEFIYFSTLDIFSKMQRSNGVYSNSTSMDTYFFPFPQDMLIDNDNIYITSSQTSVQIVINLSTKQYYGFDQGFISRFQILNTKTDDIFFFQLIPSNLLSVGKKNATSNTAYQRFTLPWSVAQKPVVDIANQKFYYCSPTFPSRLIAVNMDNPSISTNLPMENSESNLYFGEIDLRDSSIYYINTVWTTTIMNKFNSTTLKKTENVTMNINDKNIAANIILDTSRGYIYSGSNGLYEPAAVYRTNLSPFSLKDRVQVSTATGDIFSYLAMDSNYLYFTMNIGSTGRIQRIHLDSFTYVEDLNIDNKYDLCGPIKILNGTIYTLCSNRGGKIIHLAEFQTSCHKGSYLSNGKCILCDAGTFSNTNNANQCTQCSFGEYNNVNGSNSCLKCPRGTYNSLQSQTSCFSCPAGTYNENVGSISLNDCIKCSPGSSSSVIRANTSSTCLQCRPGFFSPLETNGNATSCYPCSFGTYSSSFGTNSSSFCLDCPKGFYADSGSSSCTKCPSGTSTLNTRSRFLSDCIPCPLGSWLDGTVCVSCELGFFSSLQNSTKITDCKICPKGSYTLSKGSSSCLKCSKGSFSNVLGAMNSSVCQQCIPGSFSDTDGVESCTPCKNGTYTSSYGSTTCFSCKSNEFCPFGTKIPLFLPNISNDIRIPSKDIIITDPSTVDTFSVLNSFEIFKYVIIAIVIAFILLLLILILIGFLLYLVPPLKSSLRKVYSLFINIDAYNLDHFVEQNESPVKTDMLIGSFFTLLCYSIALAVVSISIYQFSISNQFILLSQQPININATTNIKMRIDLTIFGMSEPSACNSQSKLVGFQGITNTQFSFNPNTGICSGYWNCTNCNIIGVDQRVDFMFNHDQAMSNGYSYSFQINHYKTNQNSILKSGVSLEDDKIMRGTDPMSEIALLLTSQVFKPNEEDLLGTKRSITLSYGFGPVQLSNNEGSLVDSSSFDSKKGFGIRFSFQMNPNALIYEEKFKSTLLNFLAQLISLIAGSYSGCRFIMQRFEWFGAKFNKAKNKIIKKELKEQVIVEENEK